jgi:transposase
MDRQGCCRALQRPLSAAPSHSTSFKWADALDQARRGAWNNARPARARARRTTGAVTSPEGTPGSSTPSGRYGITSPEGTPGSSTPSGRYGRTPENLTTRQQAKLEWIARTDPALYRAYMLKEGLRYVFKVKGQNPALTRIAFGFHDPAALIALALLSLGGYRPPLSGR